MTPLDGLKAARAACTTEPKVLISHELAAALEQALTPNSHPAPTAFERCPACNEPVQASR